MPVIGTNIDPSVSLLGCVSIIVLFFFFLQNRSDIPKVSTKYEICSVWRERGNNSLEIWIWPDL